MRHEAPSRTSTTSQFTHTNLPRIAAALTSHFSEANSVYVQRVLGLSSHSLQAKGVFTGSSQPATGRRFTRLHSCDAFSAIRVTGTRSPWSTGLLFLEGVVTLNHCGSVERDETEGGPAPGVKSPRRSGAARGVHVYQTPTAAAGSENLASLRAESAVRQHSPRGRSKTRSDSTAPWADPGVGQGRPASRSLEKEAVIFGMSVPLDH